MMLISKDMTALIVLPLKKGGNVLIDAHEIDYIHDDASEDRTCLRLRGREFPFIIALSVEEVVHSIKAQTIDYRVFNEHRTNR